MGMEIDAESEEFVLNALDCRVLFDPSMKRRYEATTENAVLLYERTIVAQKVHIVVEEATSNTPMDVPTAMNAQRLAEDAAIAIPRIFEVLSSFISEGMARDIETFLKPDSDEG